MESVITTPSVPLLHQGGDYRGGRKNLGVIILLLFLLSAKPTFASSTTSRITLPLTTNSTLVVSTTENTVDKKIIISDHLSSTRVILNEDGTESSSLSYYPYGEALTNNLTPLRPRLREGAAIYQFNNRYYTGQRKLPGDTLYNYNARFYNPMLGIFTQPDTVEGPNRFAYVGGNPIMATDPSGHFACPSCKDRFPNNPTKADSIPDLLTYVKVIVKSAGIYDIFSLETRVFDTVTGIGYNPERDYWAKTSTSLNRYVSKNDLGNAEMLGMAIPMSAVGGAESALAKLPTLRGSILAEIEAGGKNVTMTTVNPIIDELIAQGMSHEDAIAVVGHNIKPPYGMRNHPDVDIGQIMIDHIQGKRGPPTVDEWLMQPSLVCQGCANLVGLMGESRGLTMVYGEFEHLPTSSHAIAGVVKDGVTRVMDILHKSNSMGIDEYTEDWVRRIGRITSEIRWD
ncbi:hypothetical protein A3D80_02895 [Candidatus Roizmanbacteria bacterium RIFCSPHIGHO2_02_FULL_40_13b]|uniref:RHS repeat-associated core domain-containing protein n=1 Tax=Candidatus Roizmanbacteria bacterium RIFCSPHIGHO2_01_FULL_39_24 TaxID=1802032 RepID=A0A1F7GFJ0_9BACT|nr:MAG: hypothetical protein A2799_02845 [Candidatus Roizmanbacteria bacterium RIFCSPHIGHO2_01_FULL_39_24]OGK27139.1 MAG: hypothetical protein A3D80_02895 [Candidatus Roizmanbacteria bacterium RIFCSPHIGHO2_02_FULL_40_13b]OGK49296.1 MAG: hypothetical protein A3A56_00725 [Candidatus Roizmanbacteria bacterium RIFCSPLOWO2_01_FULL_40_32]OGK57459.1 MAG: hypothetical protein A3H83_03320 [Candidatus Roizmanbacteria bacterium RIFCSPLOWO2_02_FULL_39_8]